jgi:hypothetical protein
LDLSGDTVNDRKIEKGAEREWSVAYSTASSFSTIHSIGSRFKIDLCVEFCDFAEISTTN